VLSGGAVYLVILLTNCFYFFLFYGLYDAAGYTQEITVIFFYHF